MRAISISQFAGPVETGGHFGANHAPAGTELLSRAAELCHQVENFRDCPPDDGIRAYQEAVCYMYQIVEVRRSLEGAGMRPKEIAKSLRPALDALAASGLLDHDSVWKTQNTGLQTHQPEIWSRQPFRVR